MEEKHKNLTMGQWNVNFIRNKFKSIKSIISLIFDMFLVLETKTDESCPYNSLLIGTGYLDVTEIILVEGLLNLLKIIFYSSSRICI